MEKLTHQEEEIMLIIWQVKSGVIKDFLNRMEEPKPPYTTVASIVKNLEKKGFLTSKKHGNIYEYIPVMDESEYKTKFMSGVVRNYFENSLRKEPFDFSLLPLLHLLRILHGTLHLGN